MDTKNDDNRLTAGFYLVVITMGILVVLLLSPFNWVVAILAGVVVFILLVAWLNERKR